MSNLYLKYFPALSDIQIQQLNELEKLYLKWNNKINVISRKDTQNIVVNHVLHSLSIAKKFEFPDNSKLLDIGTGGGFPGIPLAILFPNCQFTLVDSIAKKISVVNAVKKELNLNNVRAFAERAEDLSIKPDYIISRAVTRLNRFMGWIEGIMPVSDEVVVPKKGIIYLKGGDLTEELSELSEVSSKYTIISHAISSIFDEPFFETKQIIHLYQ